MSLSKYVVGKNRAQLRYIQLSWYFWQFEFSTRIVSKALNCAQSQWQYNVTSNTFNLQTYQPFLLNQIHYKQKTKIWATFGG